MKDKKKVVTSQINEFKEFISRGNVVDMAVGVIIGNAFGKIVTSIVNDILMPLIGTILGGLDFSNLSIKVNDATIAYGSFIQSVVDFLIIAFCIFTILKLFEKFKHKEEKTEEVVTKSDEVLLLEEIRDLLKKKK
jgi:large conductance mechanosensitive channel